MKRTLLLSIFTALIATMFAQFPGGNDPYRTGGYGNDDDDGYYHDHRNDRRNQPTKRVQLALILDASGSMNGLINQAKSQFWNILNQLNYSYNGAYPLVEVAIFDYGSKYASPRRGYVRRLVPLTSDLDWAADKLYDIRTGGRHEFAGYAIQQAVDDLNWDRGYDVDKIVFIAGNERMDQGRTDYRWAIRNASRQGITVHTIFCGDYDDGIRLGWADAAYQGGGMYTALDQDAYDRRHHRYPQDDDLWRLNAQLNTTYIPYGSRGRDRCERQRRQDRNAYGFGINYAAQRAMYKASRGYMNPDWDLVDAVYYGNVDLRNVPNTDLPVEMQRMNLAQKEAYIKQKASERNQIRSRMKQLADVRQETVKREERVATNAPRRNANGTVRQSPVRAQSLDQAVRQSVGKKLSTKPVAAPSSSSAMPTQNSRSNTGSSVGTRYNTTPRSSAGNRVSTSSRSSVGNRVSTPSRSSTGTRVNSSSRSRVGSSVGSTRRSSTTTRRTTPSTVRSAPTPSRSTSVKRPAFTKPAPKPVPKVTRTSPPKTEVKKPSPPTGRKVSPRSAPSRVSSQQILKRN